MKAIGVYPLRCRDCDCRFTHQIWDPQNAIYARCPRCYRLDLSTWSLDYYRAPTRWVFYLKIGANSHRCEYCRHNFVSFRPCKVKFTGRTNVPDGIPADAKNSAKVASLPDAQA